MQCEECGCDTHDVEEYCHHCGLVYCHDHLEDEWCKACLTPTCIYPDCHCSFDMEPTGKCFRGFKDAKPLGPDLCLDKIEESD